MILLTNVYYYFCSVSFNVTFHICYVIFIWISCYFYAITKIIAEQDLGAQIIETTEEQDVETQREAMQVECQTEDKIEGRIQDEGA